jgi:hypothetical protein
MKAKTMSRELPGLNSWVGHRNNWGGSSIGSIATAAHKTAISDGTFDGIFVGDTITENGHSYYVADINYLKFKGDTSLAKNHIIVIPTKALYNAQMNETNTTEGGYVNSKMYTENLATALTQFETDFGDMLLTHREYLTNAVTNGKPSGGSWYDRKIDLMKYSMVFGNQTAFTPPNDGSTIPTHYNIDDLQLALFQLNPTAIFSNRAWFWLRDVVSSASFGRVNASGNANGDGASGSTGVLPYAAIGC